LAYSWEAALWLSAAYALSVGSAAAAVANAAATASSVEPPGSLCQYHRRRCRRPVYRPQQKGRALSQETAQETVPETAQVERWLGTPSTLQPYPLEAGASFRGLHHRRRRRLLRSLYRALHCHHQPNRRPPQTQVQGCHHQPFQRLTSVHWSHTLLSSRSDRTDVERERQLIRTHVNHPPAH